MAKTTGMGDNFYVGGFDLSGDTQSLSSIHGGSANQQDTTDITQSAVSRLALERDGGMAWTSYWDPTGASHTLLSGLPTADNICTYFRGLAIGNPAASLNSKLIGYDPTRADDGSITLAVQAQANGFGLEWGVQLTAGLRTDGSATTGAAFDWGASSAFGAQAYFQLVAFTGTSVTIDIQSATTSGGSYSTTGLTTTAMTAVGAQRLATSNSATINEFTKVVTTGTFTNAVFAVMMVRNPIAGVVF
jgi:hypothetical protein